MENETEIFPLEADPLSAHYLKGIGKAKIMAFILSALNLLIAGFGFIMGKYYGLTTDETSVVYSFGIPGLIYLVLGLASIWKPFFPLLVSALLAVIELISAIAGLIFINTFFEGVVYGSILIVIITATIFLFRGAVFAWRKKKLL